MTWHNQTLQKKWLQDGHTPQDILTTLLANNSLTFPTYKSGLTPASALPAELGEKTGMGYAWVRDNCHVANALLESGDTNRARGIVTAVLQIFKNNEAMLDAIISGATSPNEVMNRPPVRVEGDTLSSVGEWPNAQNDSIGYMLWITSKLVNRGLLTPSDDDYRVIGKIIDYLEAIAYWQDEDSGHWEEDRKLNVASIGAVVAGLNELSNSDLLHSVNHGRLAYLLKQGQQALDTLLATNMPHDASVLFLVEPLQVVNSEQASAIVAMVETHLLREFGVIRYPNDSYWGADYRQHFALGDRAEDFSDRLDERARYTIPDHEAQWTLFDPLLALYYARLGNVDKSHHYLERSLAAYLETDDGLKIPEAYFFENGDWVANDHVPLLWSQANLLLALTYLATAPLPSM